MTTAARYGAFISYSHAASAEVARGLQKWLETYAKPWWRWRAISVFRDETNLAAAPALWSRIANALDQSSHFILLASPEAARSKWIMATGSFHSLGDCPRQWNLCGKGGAGRYHARPIGCGARRMS